MFQVLYFFLMLGLVNYILYNFMKSYKRAKGNGFSRFIQATRNSATVLWARFVALVSASAGLFVGVADYLNMPEVKEIINKVMQPEYVALFIVAVAIVTEYARKRTLEE